MLHCKRMLPEKPSRFKLKFTQKVFFMIQNMMNHKKIMNEVGASFHGKNHESIQNVRSLTKLPVNAL
jgi:inhibitor of KinA sporulation pathway (predicted exonuclease)